MLDHNLAYFKTILTYSCSKLFENINNWMFETVCSESTIEKNKENQVSMLLIISL